MRASRERKANSRLTAAMEGTLASQDAPRGEKDIIAFLDAWVSLNQSVRPSTEERERVSALLTRLRTDVRLIRELSARDPYRRSRAARYLGYVATERSERAVALALRQETDESAMLFLVHALANLEESAALPDIIDSLYGRSTPFIMRVAGLLLGFQSSFIALFPELEARREREIVELLVEYSRLAHTKSFYPYLLALFREEATGEGIRRKAFDCLVEYYPFALNPADHLKNDDPEIARRACLALGERPGTANARILLSLARNGTEADRVNTAAGLAGMIARSPRVFLYLVSVLRDDINGPDSPVLCDVLSGRIDYFLLKNDTGHVSVTGRIVKNALLRGRVSDLISFLNKNRDLMVEDRLVRALRSGITEVTLGLGELRTYLNPRILQKLGLSQLPVPNARVGQKKNAAARAPLVALLTAALGAFPVTVLVFILATAERSVTRSFRIATNAFLSAFGWYTLATLVIGLTLAGLAWFESSRQRGRYVIKDASLLFSRNVLPPITIIAPAYNEAVGIVESVESLLNVNYPDFEIVVVNDGSRDATLAVLIDRFRLERTDGDYRETLRTQPVRGIYKNPKIRELTVIDKVNGGKADSLNVGINAASGEYVLAIDSDSVLERDALLALTSAFLDSNEPVVATGGNIMPANGCSMDRGQLVEKRTPKSPIPAFQTIEYLRAFMTGRLGWSRLGTLMIISGAFGVFRKEEVLAINGYLTSREKYETDTVGEDMELVIRIERSMREAGRPHRITYNCMANCWTEVPSNFAVLRRQRERWQRGLLEILSFHRKMIGNPKYGTYGLVGFPYFLVFEVAGPWLELVGFIVFAVSLATGTIDASVLRFIVGVNLGHGLMLSALAILINERNGHVFPLIDRLGLMIAALGEQAGFRQLVSLFRVSGYIGMIRGITEWGTMTRRGFRKASKGKTHDNAKANGLDRPRGAHRG